MGCSTPAEHDAVTMKGVNVPDVPPGVLSRTHGEHFEPPLLVRLGLSTEVVRPDIVASLGIRLPDIDIRKW